MKRPWKTVTVWLLTTALIHGHWLAAIAAASDPAVLRPTSAPKVERKASPKTDGLGKLDGDAARSAEEGSTADVDYVPPTATAALILHPRRVLTAPESELLPLEVISAAGKKEFGLDPMQIDWAVGVVEVSEFGPPQFGLILRSSAPLDDSRLLASLKRNTEQRTLEGRPYYRAENPMFMPSIFLPDDHSVIVAQEAMLQKMLTNHRDPQPGKVSRIIADMKRLPDVAAALDFAPLRPMVQSFLMRDPPPPPLAALQDVPPLVADMEAQIDLIGNWSMYLAIRANNNTDALKLQNTISGILEQVRATALEELERQAESDDPIEQAMAQYMRRITDRYLGFIQPERKGNTVYKRIDEGRQAQMATIGVLVALLLPAVQSAREAARLSQSLNNLKQLGLAMHNYHDVYRRFPARAIFDSEGRPLLSWRVEILPFLECQDLYEQFHLDEPWDSEHNKTLIPLMPEVYKNPSAATEPGMAHYLALVGPGTLFEGREPRTFADIRDGTSNTIMLVEVNPDRAVVWTQPNDLEFDPENPLNGLGSAHPGGFGVLLCDGSVRFVSAVIDAVTFRRLAQIADGEVVQDY
ncbi:DUF1559 domain-containing protein [Thermopirellula anaerolimosa]